MHMAARHGVVQPEPVPQQRRPVGDLVREVVAAASGPRGRTGVGPFGRTTGSVPPAGISVTSVWSYTGNRPVLAATISLYGRVVDVHCGCEAGSVTGTVSVLLTLSLSGKPPRQAPLVRSTSNRPTRPWLTVVNRSTCFIYGRSVRSTVPSAKSRQRTGNTTVSTRAGPSAVSITVPSRASAVAPEGWRSGCPGPV